jgi:hypothetical protein
MNKAWGGEKERGRRDNQHTLTHTLDTLIVCTSGEKVTIALHLLQSNFQFGAEFKSRTRVPPHKESPSPTPTALSVVQSTPPNAPTQHGGSVPWAIVNVAHRGKKRGSEEGGSKIPSSTTAYNSIQQHTTKNPLTSDHAIGLTRAHSGVDEAATTTRPHNVALDRAYYTTPILHIPPQLQTNAPHATHLWPQVGWRHVLQPIFASPSKGGKL